MTDNVMSRQQATTSSFATNLPQFRQPQLLTPQPYIVYNNPFYAAPFSQYAYTTSNQFLPQFIQTVPTISTEKSTTPKPKVKDIEPTTRRPQGALINKPPKLQLKPEISGNPVGDFRNDAPLLQAVSQINPEFIIEDIMPVPGKHVFSFTNKQKITRPNNLQRKAQSENIVAKTQTTKFSRKKIGKTPVNSQVKVESTGRTSTKGNIPQIPFGTFFLPYFSEGQQQPQTKTASLILEPHSKAIVGNGGTAISTPISRAFLKRGVATNVYFNPESVAIAGVGGKAHAQADLELDLIN